MEFFSPAFLQEQLQLAKIFLPDDPATASAGAGPGAYAWAGCGPKRGCKRGGGWHHHHHGHGGSEGHGPHGGGEGHRHKRGHWWHGGKPTDIAEGTDEWVLLTSVPGFSIEDLKVEVNGDVLTVSGDSSERPSLLPEGAVLHRSERRTSTTFSRAFELPDNIDVNGIKAKVELGVLRIALPKKKPAPKPAPVIISIEDSDPTQGPSTDAALAKPPSAAGSPKAEQEGWVDVDSDMEDVKGKAPMEPEVAAEVERQLNELKVQQKGEESD